MVKDKIMYYFIFPSKSFWIWWLTIVVSVSGKLVHGLELLFKEGNAAPGSNLGV